MVSKELPILLLNLYNERTISISWRAILKVSLFKFVHFYGYIIC